MDISNLAIQIAIIIGLLEVIKQSLLTEDHLRFVPLIALGIGVVITITLFPAATLQQSIIDGIVAALSSVGLFSTVKNAVQ